MCHIGMYHIRIPPWEPGRKAGAPIQRTIGSVDKFGRTEAAKVKMTNHWFKEPAIALGITCMLFAGGCRTSQQARRNDAKSGRTPVNAQGVQADSLLMIQQRLLDLVDTMADALARDRSRIRVLELEVARLRSEVERTRYSQSMADGSRYAIPPPSAPVPPQNFEGRQSDLPSQNPVEPSESRPGTTTGPAPTRKETPPAQQNSHDYDAAVKESYAEALRLFNEAHYDDALLAFRLLERNDPEGPMASNYIYWQGECLYGLERDNESLQTFSTVVDRFPASQKADAAQFKIGECYEKLGSPASARLAYQKLLQNYPDTGFRSRAEARMKRLK